MNAQARCECERGPVSVVAFKRNTSLLIRRIGDMGFASSPDWRCIDCVAEMAAEIAACTIRSFHSDCCCESSPPEFGGNLPDRECVLHGKYPEAAS